MKTAVITGGSGGIGRAAAENSQRKAIGYMSSPDGGARLTVLHT